jgi:hypothetical protein
VSKSSGVIVQTVEAGFFNAPPKAQASNIYVVYYRDGRVQAFTGVPSQKDRWGSRFCYIVDTAERRVRDSFTVPSMTDAYSFGVEAEATWKVTSPEAVVRAGLTDGNEVVLAWLKDELWVVGRDYSPGDAAGAEATARSVLSGARGLAEGVTILRATARFQVDAHLTTATIERDADTHQGTLDRQRTDRLQQMLDGSDEAMVVMHLLRHPDDTGSMLQMMADARDKNQAVRLGLLDRMLVHNLITDADAQPLRDAVLGQPISSSVIKMRPISSRAMPAALPPGAPQALPSAGSPGSASAGSRPPKKTYAVVDTPSSAPPAPTGPAAPSQQVQPDPQPAAEHAPASGRVKAWKQLKKSPGQEDE